MTNAEFMAKWQLRAKHTSSPRLAVKREDLERLVALASRVVTRDQIKSALNSAQCRSLAPYLNVVR